MQETLEKKLRLSEEEKERILQIFSDPVKILIVFKILKNPGITSKELKDEINLKGTKIYYYLSDFEGLHPKTKEKLHLPLVRVETEETVNHLLMKKYYPNEYLRDLIRYYDMFDLFDDPQKNVKWNYIIGINIGLALLQSHLRDVEKKPLEEFREGTEFRKMISFNNVGFVQKRVYEKNKKIMKNLFDSICSENNTESLIQSMENSTHAFVFGATEW